MVKNGLEISVIETCATVRGFGPLLLDSGRLLGRMRVA
jgi:hypothetical protein